jgi:hypothetical protein
MKKWAALTGEVGRVEGSREGVQNGEGNWLFKSGGGRSIE